MIKTVFLLWQGLTFALMFHFSISANIVNKKRKLNELSVSFSPDHSYQYNYCSQ